MKDMFCTVRKDQKLVCKGTTKAVFCYLAKEDDTLLEVVHNWFSTRKYAEILILDQQDYEETPEDVFNCLLGLVCRNYKDFKSILINMGYSFSYEEENYTPKFNSISERSKLDNESIKH